jgi:hypothetical protein
LRAVSEGTNISFKIFLPKERKEMTLKLEKRDVETFFLYFSYFQKNIRALGVSRKKISSSGRNYEKKDESSEL